MEILKKKRKVIRSQVTRFTSDDDKILSSTSAVELEEVSVLIERLRLAERQLKDADTAIEPHLREEDAEDEFETVLKYSDKLATIITSTAALRHLLRFFELELQSRERTQEDRQNDASGKATSQIKYEDPATD
ncbi:hypothetical protein MTO96_046355 [Rhipicephalus appendiculatus]